MVRIRRVPDDGVEQMSISIEKHLTLGSDLHVCSHRSRQDPFLQVRTTEQGDDGNYPNGQKPAAITPVGAHSTDLKFS